MVWWGCSSVGRSSDRHSAEAVSIPQCGKGFFSQSQLSMQTLLWFRKPPCATACINICTHVKDPVVHVRVQWIMETLKHPASTVSWVPRLCRSWLSPGKATQIASGRNPSGTIHLLKKYIKKLYIKKKLYNPQRKQAYIPENYRLL